MLSVSHNQLGSDVMPDDDMPPHACSRLQAAPRGHEKEGGRERVDMIHCT